MVGAGNMTTAVAPRLPKGTTDKVLERMFPEPNPYAGNPQKWINQKLREVIWSKQDEICDSVIENRHTAVHSCHGTGKSYIASRVAAWWIDAHPPGDAFVVSTAPSQTQVEAILWREIGRAHRKGDLVGRTTAGMVPQWKIGSEIVGFGRKPQDLASKEEAMAAFQGIHAKYILVVIDEGGGVPKWLYDAVDSLATNDNARVLVIGNPDDPASHFESVCRPGSGWNVIHIGYEDTPAYTGEKVPDSLLEDLISPTWVEERKQRWGETSPLYISKVLGLFPEVGENTLISPKVLRACQELDLPGTETGQYGYDIARFGHDRTEGYRCRGGVIRNVYSRHGQDTMKTADDIYDEVERHKGKAPAVVDVIGIGSGVVDRLAQRRINVIPHNASEQAIEPHRFVNRRAEVFWHFKEMCEEGGIDLPDEKEDDELISQLGTIRWGSDGRGRIKIESKDEMKKRGLPSPDKADAAVMSAMGGIKFYIPQRHLSESPMSGSEEPSIMERTW